MLWWLMGACACHTHQSTCSLAIIVAAGENALNAFKLSNFLSSKDV